MERAKQAPVQPMIYENNTENSLDTTHRRNRSLPSTLSENEKVRTNLTHPTLVLQLDPRFII